MKKKTLKAGLIGCGTIGQVIADAIKSRFRGQIKLVAICDKDKKKAISFAKKLKVNAPVVGIRELISKSRLVIEAASCEASYGIAREALSAGRHVLIMSSGGLIGKKDISGLARRKNARIYIPSGAVCGLDGLKAAMAAKVDSVTLTTKKPAASLEGAPYVIRNRIDLGSIKKETVIFDGTAKEAIRGFPKNINVSATLSLCGIGPEATRVRIVAVPHSAENIHEIEVRGAFGSLKTVSINKPMPDNPRTSYVAALSAVATLKNIVGEMCIGT